MVELPDPFSLCTSTTYNHQLRVYLATIYDNNKRTLYGLWLALISGMVEGWTELCFCLRGGGLEMREAEEDGDRRKNGE